MVSSSLYIHDLKWNTFGRAGCEELAALLRDPNDNLTCLALGNNNRIDDNCATILGNSLELNSKLESLDLSRNEAITENGWDSFSKVLCNMSSVNATYLSNHTMDEFGLLI